MLSGTSGGQFYIKSSFCCSDVHLLDGRLHVYTTQEAEYRLMGKVVHDCDWNGRPYLKLTYISQSWKQHGKIFSYVKYFPKSSDLSTSEVMFSG